MHLNEFAQNSDKYSPDTVTGTLFGSLVYCLGRWDRLWDVLEMTGSYNLDPPDTQFDFTYML